MTEKHSLLTALGEAVENAPKELDHWTDKVREYERFNIWHEDGYMKRMFRALARRQVAMEIQRQIESHTNVAQDLLDRGFNATEHLVFELKQKARYGIKNGIGTSHPIELWEAKLWLAFLWPHVVDGSDKRLTLENVVDYFDNREESA